MALPRSAAAAVEPQREVRIPAAMPDRFPEPQVSPGDRKPGEPCLRRQPLANLFAQLRGDRLIRIDAQDPVAGGLFGGEVLLIGETLERPDEYSGAIARGDLSGAVLAAGVHQNDFVAPRQATQAFLEVLFLVERDHGGRHSERAVELSQSGSPPELDLRAKM